MKRKCLEYKLISKRGSNLLQSFVRFEGDRLRYNYCVLLFILIYFPIGLYMHYISLIFNEKYENEVNTLLCK